MSCNRKGDNLSATHVQELIESFVDDLDVVGCDPLYAVVTELLDSHQTVTVDIHHFEIGFDESSHCLHEMGKDSN